MSETITKKTDKYIIKAQTQFQKDLYVQKPYDNQVFNNPFRVGMYQRPSLGFSYVYTNWKYIIRINQNTKEVKTFKLPDSHWLHGLHCSNMNECIFANGYHMTIIDKQFKKIIFRDTTDGSNNFQSDNRCRINVTHELNKTNLISYVRAYNQIQLMQSRNKKVLVNLNLKGLKTLDHHLAQRKHLIYVDDYIRVFNICKRELLTFRDDQYDKNKFDLQQMSRQEGVTNVETLRTCYLPDQQVLLRIGSAQCQKKNQKIEKTDKEDPQVVNEIPLQTEHKHITIFKIDFESSGPQGVVTYQGMYDTNTIGKFSEGCMINKELLVLGSWLAPFDIFVLRLYEDEGLFKLKTEAYFPKLFQDNSFGMQAEGGIALLTCRKNYLCQITVEEIKKQN